MKFVIITRIPVRKGLLGPIPAKDIVEYTEAETIDEVIEGLNVPLDGKVLIANEFDVVEVKATVVNKRVTS